MTVPKLKVGDQVKYTSVVGNIVIAQVIELRELQFVTKTITVSGQPYTGPESHSHDYIGWAISGFKLLRQRIRFIDHDAYYTTESVEVWE